MSKLESEVVSRYLSSRLEAPVSIRSMKQTFPGASRETWLIQAEVGKELQGFALRVDLPGGDCVPLSLRREYEVYSRLYGSSVPVAEPLWYDEKIDFVEGRPHMVRRLVEGSTNIPGLSDATTEGAELRKRVAFECMEKLALVHLLDWKAIGLHDVLPEPPSAAEALATEFALWRGYWDEKNPYADPVLEEALCWLSEHIPTDTPRISLVKGNNGVGEEIFVGDKIIAMSDWELASLGDSALDIGWSQGTLQLADSGEILRHYEQCLGAKISLQRLAFSMFLIWLKQLVCVKAYMYPNYTAGRSRRIIDLTFGLVHAEGTLDRLAKCIGKDIVEAWLEVSGQERSIYATFGGKKK